MAKKETKERFPSRSVKNGERGGIPDDALERRHVKDYPKDVDVHKRRIGSWVDSAYKKAGNKPDPARGGEKIPSMKEMHERATHKKGKF